MRLARGRIWRTNLLRETCGQNHRECWDSYQKGRGGLRVRSRKSRGFLEEKVQGLLLLEYGHLLIGVFSRPSCIVYVQDWLGIFLLSYWFSQFFCLLHGVQKATDDFVLILFFDFCVMYLVNR